MRAAQGRRVEAGKAVQQLTHRGWARQACQACWPWMSSSASASSRSWATVAALPLTQARLGPARRSPGAAAAWAGLEAGIVQPGRRCRAVELGRDVGPRRALAHHAGIARPPSTSCSASIRMDLPAPVSPVSTAKPPVEARAPARTMTMTKSLIAKAMASQHGRAAQPRLRSSAACGAAWRSSSNPRVQETTECARAPHHDAVAHQQAGQALHVEVDAGVAARRRSP